jgi:hypothetical protein
MEKDRVSSLFWILVALTGGSVHFATERIIIYLSTANLNLNKPLIYGYLIIFLIILIFSIYSVFKVKQIRKKSEYLVAILTIIGCMVGIEGIRVLVGLLL